MSVFTEAFACTRILDANNGQSVLVGRTMDWYQDMKTNIVVYPRGIEREGMAIDKSLTWTSKYGNIVATVFDTMSTDGMNEQGLAAHILWLDDADYGKRETKIPGLSVGLWAQFYLDNFRDVEEAVRFTEKKSFQLEQLFDPKTNERVNVHLALEDASGDSAIIEYTKGAAHIYHNRNYTVLTNSPSFNKQLKNLQKYKGWGGKKSLPGSTGSLDRFVRASYYSAHLPKAQSPRESINAMLSVVQTITEPYGDASLERPEIEPTLWSTVTDLTHKVYYFNSSTSLSFIWINLDKFNLMPGSPIMKLDLVNNPDLVGDVSEALGAVDNATIMPKNR